MPSSTTLCRRCRLHILGACTHTCSLLGRPAHTAAVTNPIANPALRLANAQVLRCHLLLINLRREWSYTLPDQSILSLREPAHRHLQASRTLRLPRRFTHRFPARHWSRKVVVRPCRQLLLSWPPATSSPLGSPPSPPAPLPSVTDDVSPRSAVNRAKFTLGRDLGKIRPDLWAEFQRKDPPSLAALRWLEDGKSPDGPQLLPVGSQPHHNSMM